MRTLATARSEAICSPAASAWRGRPRRARRPPSARPRAPLAAPRSTLSAERRAVTARTAGSVPTSSATRSTASPARVHDVGVLGGVADHGRAGGAQLREPRVLDRAHELDERECLAAVGRVLARQRGPLCRVDLAAGRAATSRMSSRRAGAGGAQRPRRPPRRPRPARSRRSARPRARRARERELPLRRYPAPPAGAEWCQGAAIGAGQRTRRLRDRLGRPRLGPGDECARGRYGAFPALERSSRD